MTAPTNRKPDLLAQLTKRARDESQLAYEYTPNSYTYASFHAALAAHQELTRLCADVPQGHNQCG
jgi:hypothetical protein